MAETVDIAFNHGYSAEITRLYAAMEDKVRDAVRIKSGSPGKTFHFDRLADDADFQTISSRHQPTHVMNPTHSKRRVSFTDKGGAYVLEYQVERGDEAGFVPPLFIWYVLRFVIE